MRQCVLKIQNIYFSVGINIGLSVPVRTVHYLGNQGLDIEDIDLIVAVSIPATGMMVRRNHPHPHEGECGYQYHKLSWCNPFSLSHHLYCSTLFTLCQVDRSPDFARFLLLEKGQGTQAGRERSQAPAFQYTSMS
jgi:hypothetical protein